jgi:HSP20 family molecular chaperone IbpA
LPEGVDVGSVSAELKNGELTIHVPKTHETQPKKISLSKGGKDIGGKAKA